jgi:hypothetical protein
VRYGVSLFSGTGCAAQDETFDSPIPEFNCTRKCYATSPIRSIFLEALEWHMDPKWRTTKDRKKDKKKDKKKTEKIQKEIHGPTILEMSTEKLHQSWVWWQWERVALQGPTVKLYARSGCAGTEGQIYLGRAYIPEEMPFACIDLPQEVNSVVLEEIAACRESEQQPVYKPPHHMDMNRVTVEELRKSYPNIDWDAWIERKRKQQSKNGRISDLGMAEIEETIPQDITGGVSKRGVPSEDERKGRALNGVLMTKEFLERTFREALGISKARNGTAKAENEMAQQLHSYRTSLGPWR